MLNKVCFVAKTTMMVWDGGDEPMGFLCAKCWPRTHTNFEVGCIYKPYWALQHLRNKK